MIQKFNLKKILKNEKIILYGLFVSLGLITFLLTHSEEKVAPVMEASQDIDELIPQGFVLLPIDLVNREALSSIMGSTAVVDILTVHPTTMSPQLKIASRVKLIRTPKNPDFFALLVEEQASSQILSKPGPYFALIQNKKQTKSDFYKDKQKTHLEINYQE